MRGKKKKFAENKLRANVIEPGKPVYEQMKGNWRSQYFKREGPLVLELACGWGEYTLGLATVFPSKNFIGVDIKGDRIWKGSGRALQEGLENVAFLRCHLLELQQFFEPGEADEIWLTFPDPRPRKRDQKRRVLHSRYLDIYKDILSARAPVRLKTDDDGLFQFTLDTLNERNDITELAYTWDLYDSVLKEEHYGIQTKYELRFLEMGKRIKYLKFKFA